MLNLLQLTWLLVAVGSAVASTTLGVTTIPLIRQLQAHKHRRTIYANYLIPPPQFNFFDDALTVMPTIMAAPQPDPTKVPMSTSSALTDMFLSIDEPSLTSNEIPNPTYIRSTQPENSVSSFFRKTSMMKLAISLAKWQKAKILRNTTVKLDENKGDSPRTTPPKSTVPLSPSYIRY